MQQCVTTCNWTVTLGSLRAAGSRSDGYKLRLLKREMVVVRRPGSTNGNGAGSSGFISLRNGMGLRESALAGVGCQDAVMNGSIRGRC